MLPRQVGEREGHSRQKGWQGHHGETGVYRDQEWLSVAEMQPDGPVRGCGRSWVQVQVLCLSSPLFSLEAVLFQRVNAKGWSPVGEKLVAEMRKGNSSLCLNSIS